jgi:hypothetical protein
MDNTFVPQGLNSTATDREQQATNNRQQTTDNRQQGTLSGRKCRNPETERGSKPQRRHEEQLQWRK